VTTAEKSFSTGIVLDITNETNVKDFFEGRIKEDELAIRSIAAHERDGQLLTTDEMADTQDMMSEVEYILAAEGIAFCRRAIQPDYQPVHLMPAQHIAA
jgi:hypothetical protein